MLVNVFTFYDNSKKPIARIRVDGSDSGYFAHITERTYKRLMRQRCVWGTAGIYTDAGFAIAVRNKTGDVITYI